MEIGKAADLQSQKTNIQIVQYPVCSRCLKQLLNAKSDRTTHIVGNMFCPYAWQRTLYSIPMKTTRKYPLLSGIGLRREHIIVEK